MEEEGRLFATRLRSPIRYRRVVLEVPDLGGFDTSNVFLNG